ncbi:MAG: LysM peptidoglycan-binding domain-containing protein [Devosia sp.]
MVIVGVLAGPSIATCFNSADGMGLCLRGKMTDAGILPRPALAVAEPPAVPPPPAEVAPEVALAKPDVAPAPTDVAVGEPALDVTPPAETPTPAPEDLIAATFGLLRAEPDGSVVIAGSGTPGSEVEVYSNDTLLGKAKVESSGDWVLVPDAPIPPGGTELTLAEAGKEGRAASSFVIVINDDKSSEPLVVASTPGHASDILQGLERPAAGTTTEVATAEPPTPAAEAPAATEPAPAAALAADAPAAAANAAPPVDAATPTPAAAVPAAAEPAAAAEVPANADVTPPADVAAPDVAVAIAEPAVPTPAKPELPALANVPPTIDAIEIEGKNSFFAGGGPEGAMMRLYVDGTYVADTKVVDGRWLVEAGNVLTKPSQRIRVDMLKPGSADVAARAEVNFDVQLPADKPVTVAAAEPVKPTPPATEPPPAKPPVAALPAETAVVPPSETPAVTPDAPAVADSAAPAVPPAEDKSAPLEVATNTVAPPVAAGDKSSVTENRPASPPVEPVAVAKPAEQPAAVIANTAKPETEAVAESTPQLAEAPQVNKPAPIETANAAPIEPVAPAETPAIAAVESPAAPPAVAPAEPAVQTAEATPAEPATAAPEVPTLVAVAVGDPELARFASGKAIIRRGDNLWTIARRVYGAGIRYTAIYEANNGQISNPNRIYPGQVFDLPKAAQ